MDSRLGVPTRQRTRPPGTLKALPSDQDPIGPSHSPSRIADQQLTTPDPNQRQFRYQETWKVFWPTDFRIKLNSLLVSDGLMSVTNIFRSLCFAKNARSFSIVIPVFDERTLCTSSLFEWVPAMTKNVEPMTGNPWMTLVEFSQYLVVTFTQDNR
eukprot:g34413.t1